jgi:hypothetical protein
VQDRLLAVDASFLFSEIVGLQNLLVGGKLVDDRDLVLEELLDAHVHLRKRSLQTLTFILNF